MSLTADLAAENLRVKTFCPCPINNFSSIEPNAFQTLVYVVFNRPDPNVLLEKVINYLLKKNMNFETKS